MVFLHTFWFHHVGIFSALFIQYTHFRAPYLWDKRLHRRS
uniref:Uncharacterized protein n=1 Tax=Anguilla anguilla TaxID=7936 RepID=A0A0E9U750_ANGAN